MTARHYLKTICIGARARRARKQAARTRSCAWKATLEGAITLQLRSPRNYMNRKLVLLLKALKVVTRWLALLPI